LCKYCSDIGVSGQLNICHPSAGIELNTGTFGVCVSSKDQAENNELMNLGLRKRHRGTNNGCSQVTLEHGEVILQEGRGYKKRRGCDGKICSTISTQGTSEYTNLHENTICMQKDSFLAMHALFSFIYNDNFFRGYN
jgi:hypothetical protein